MRRLYQVAVASLVLVVSGCPASEPKAEEGARQSKPVMTQDSASFEDQVMEYLRAFPYQETYRYVLLYTGGDPAKFNTWVPGGEPSLVRAGEDPVVRMNNDTFYNGAYLYLEDGPVVISSSAATEDRFYSFQLMDDRNVNYRNIIHPDGDYTFYYGERPDQIEGQAIEVPSVLSVVVARIEVKDKEDPQDVAAAKAVYEGMTITANRQVSGFPQLDLLSEYPAEVAAEADRRMDEAFATTPFPQLVLRHGAELGVDVSYVSHAAATKHAWGAPDPSHSSYESLFFDVDGEEMLGSKGTYTATTGEPPVGAFWSVTVYDTDRGGFLHPNEDDRHHINNTTAVRSSDGTVTLVFKENCGASDSNCLQVPASRFDVAIRYYLPHEEIITGDWTFPGIRLRADQ
jgi:hypothetical protein